MTCGDYDVTTATCLTCINSAYYLSSGQCLVVDCGVGKYWSTAVMGCTILPEGCTAINLINQICDKCGSGFARTSTGVCISTTLNCYSYNNSSKLCEGCSSGYQLTDGYCKWIAQTSCESGYDLINGSCIKKNNCTSTQVYINDQCVNLPDNCLSINIYYHCTKCKDNYRM